ncbi:MAG: hypothetical protein HY033_10500 [Ignavibacteriae bacterium]|nr:hypothetical protein [Ignavibacteriota bacterium]
MGLQFARLQFRSDIDKVQPMTDFFRNARTVLVALPVGYEDAVLAGNALKVLHDRMERMHLTVIHTGTRATPLSVLPHSEVVRIGPTDINRFSLPRRSLLQRIAPQSFDVALDLNLDFVLHTAYICKVTRAGVRVGFAHDVSDSFFNVQLHIDRPRTPRSPYEHVATFLSMF